MKAEFVDALKQIEREKGIKTELVIDALKTALLSAYKKKYGPAHDSRIEIDTKTGEIKVVKTVTDGEEKLDVEVTPENFGRIAAQTAKQVIKQRILEVERDLMYEEYHNRVGDLVTGIVQQNDQRFTLVDLGKVEALLPPNEQVPGEVYGHGRRLKCYIADVRRSTRGPSVIISRTHPGLVKRLFELEVPEVYDGIIEIKEMAREPGHRTKIAVASRDPDVDPVGACVGPRGSRVRMVVSELNNEKIDILAWSEDPAEFVKNAMSPAKVKKVIMDQEERTALVIVPDDQLSLAIGKEGQNARLAARLTGWRIDIKSENQFKAEQEERLKSLAEEERPYCQATKRDGQRCQNRAVEGSNYCGIPSHQRQAQG